MKKYLLLLIMLLSIAKLFPQQSCRGDSIVVREDKKGKKPFGDCRVPPRSTAFVTPSNKNIK